MRQPLFYQTKEEPEGSSPRRLKYLAIYASWCSSYRAGAGAGAAIDAGIRVDDILTVAFRDCGNRAIRFAGAAGNAFVRNYICMDDVPPSLFRTGAEEQRKIRPQRFQQVVPCLSHCNIKDEKSRACHIFQGLAAEKRRRKKALSCVPAGESFLRLENSDIFTKGIYFTSKIVYNSNKSFVSNLRGAIEREP